LLVPARFSDGVADMDLRKPIRNLVLIGFMGSGKSSVGREIARRWDFRFFDTDSIIRHKYGKTIPEIFSTWGEATFREEEHLVLKRFQYSRGIILATGGGIVTQPRNLPLLRQLGVIVWLVADEGTTWLRVHRNPNRPLLQTDNPRETIRKLLSERAPLYQSIADLTIDSTGLSHSEVADRILSCLQNSADY
jgi:shikimate kinase